MYRPEFIENGTIFLFREGLTKGIGKVQSIVKNENIIIYFFIINVSNKYKFFYEEVLNQKLNYAKPNLNLHYPDKFLNKR